MSGKRGWALLAAPNGAYVGAMLIAPLAYLVSLSVTRYSPTTLLTGEFTLDSFRKLLDPSYVTLFVRTFRIALLSTIVTAVLAYPVAYLLARSTPRIRAVGMFLIITPLMISSVVRVYGWVIVLSRTGLLNQVLAYFHLPRTNLLYSEAAVLFGLIQLFVPIMVLPLLASIEKIPVALEEASVSLGGNWLVVFRRVILPLSLPGLISGCVLTFATSVSAFITPALLGGPRDRMITQQIYEKVLVTFNLPEAAAITAVLLVLTIALGAITVAVSRRPGWARQS